MRLTADDVFQTSIKLLASPLKFTRKRSSLENCKKHESLSSALTGSSYLLQ